MVNVSFCCVVVVHGPCLFFFSALKWWPRGFRRTNSRPLENPRMPIRTSSPTCCRVSSQHELHIRAKWVFENAKESAPCCLRASAKIVVVIGRVGYVSRTMLDLTSRLVNQGYVLQVELVISDFPSVKSSSSLPLSPTPPPPSIGPMPTSPSSSPSPPPSPSSS